MKYYKVLGQDGKCCHGGSGSWHLPCWRAVGKWMPRIENIEPCKRGYHICHVYDLIKWLDETIWEVELDTSAERLVEYDKVVTTGPVRLIQKMNWNEQIAWKFAFDCLQHAQYNHIEGTKFNGYPFTAGTRGWTAAQIVARDTALHVEILSGYQKDAWVHERAWQATRLLQYLEGEI